MNRKIGEYIHLHSVNYREYGINRRSEGPSPAFNFNDYKNIILNRIKNTSDVDSKDLEEIQEYLNQFFKGKGDDIDEDTVKLAWEVIKKEMEDEFGNTLGSINEITGDIEKATTASVKNGVSTSLQKIEPQGKAINISTILKRMQVLELSLNHIDDVKKKAELNKELKFLYQEIKNITGVLVRDLRSRSKASQISIERTERIDNLISKINTLVKTYATTPALNLQKGELFEFLIAMLPGLAKSELQVGMKELEDLVKENKKGQDRASVSINLENFTDEIDWNAVSHKGYVIDNDTKTMVSVLASQGKVDVAITWNDKYIPISAKNVNINSSFGVHVLSGSSLLYLLQDENTDFVNHYLNILAQHDDGEINLPAAHDAAKTTILYKALSGKTYGRENMSADIFLVNDNKSGTVRAYDIPTLVKKASENLDLYTEITANKTDLAKIKLKNEYVESGYKSRISNLIAQVHQQKVSAALKPNLLLNK